MNLKKAIASKNYADRIFLAGDVEHKITLHLIKRADILLRTTKFDGDAIAVREALFLDTPVIATDNGLRPAGINLIPIHDADALVSEIENLANEEKKIKCEKPDDKSNINEILTIYEEVFDKCSSNKLSQKPRQTEKKGII